MDSSEAAKRIVDWMVEQRLAMNLTQAELASAIGIHQTQISKIENKIKQIDLVELIAICQALEIEPHTAVRHGTRAGQLSILDQWEISEDILTEIVESQPSLRGMMLGYVAEAKLADFMDAHDHVSSSFKHDDHCRTGKGDRVIEYKDHQFIIECKSLQTNTIQSNDERLVARAQVDASDRRPVVLEDGTTVNTTCLKVGEFDVLAVNTFMFGKGWEFQFAKNSELPRSRYNKYSETIRSQLLAITVQISDPPDHPFTTDLFGLLDDIIRTREEN